MRPSPYANGSHVSEEHDGALPDVAVETSRRELLTGDGVGRPQHLQTLGGDRTDDADAEARAGEGLAPHDGLRHPQLEPDLAHLVLEQRPQRLDQLELQVLRKATHVVVRLDVGRAGAAAGLHHVGVEGALDEELHRVVVGAAVRAHDVTGRLLEDPDELPADDPALLLGIRDAVERGENRSRASTTTRSTPVAATKSFSTCSASPARSRPSTKTQVAWSPTAFCTRAAATDESTPPDSAHSTRDSPTCSRIACDQLVDDVGRRPVALDARPTPQEVLQHPLPERGVHDLGVPLHSVQPALVVLEGRHRAPAVDAVTRMPSGAPVTESPWLIQTDCSSGWPLKSTETSVIRAGVAPYSPSPVLATVPPRAWTMAWKP